MATTDGSYEERLTINVAKYHEMIESGKATIYRILLVKFNNKQKLPKNPQARDTAFKEISLILNINIAPCIASDIYIYSHQ